MKNKQNQELAVCGFAAVKAIEKHNSEKIKRLYFTGDRAVAFGSLCKLLASRKIPYNLVESPIDLEKLCGSVHHQGVVAMISSTEIPQLTKTDTDAWLERNESVIFLDRIGNANNLGAIVRSAAFFGIKNIIIPLDEAQSSITTSTYRVAQGGMEKVDIFTVESPSKFLSAMKNKMVRIGTDLRAKKSVAELDIICKNKPSIIILGNEETGISDEIRSFCDELIIIPGISQEEFVESLNVAQAAAVIFYEWTKYKTRS